MIRWLLLLIVLTLPVRAQERVVNIYNWTDYIDPSVLADFTKETGIKVNYVQIPQATILDKEAIAQRAKSSDFAMYEGPTSLISQDIGLLGGVGLSSFESNSKLGVTGFSTNGMGELGDCTLNGTLYCLPVFVDGSVIAYNKNLLSKAGISTPPATWAQVVTDADQTHSIAEAEYDDFELAATP